MSNRDDIINWNEIVDDPDCHQIIRDLARTKLAENEALKGSDTYKMGLDPIWANTVEINESYGIASNILSDTSLVKIASKVLLHDEDSDGCSSVKCMTLPDGTMDVLGAYPKLVSTCRKIIHDKSSGKDPDLLADAHIVLGSLYQLQSKPFKEYQEEERHFKKAVRFRPNDWRIHSSMSAMYMKHDQVALSLECITRAAELVQSKKAKFELLSKKGKLLSNLSRNEDAIACLEQAMLDYDDIKDDMSPKDKGHSAIAQYALCFNYSASSHSKKYRQKMLHHWKQAESKRSMLPSDIIAHMDWGFRTIAQLVVAKIKPDAALSHRECHYCHAVTDDAKRCSACKAAVYCSKECQVKAWKAGHKKECTKANTARKQEKKELKIKVHKPLIDEFLTPKNLWKKGLKMMKDGNPNEAVWNFLVALFMDFSLDNEANVLHLKKAVDLVLAGDRDPDLDKEEKYIATVLSMMTHYGRNNPVSFSEKILGILSTSKTIIIEKEAPTKLDEVNRHQFAFGVARIFHARWITRCFGLQQGVDQQTNRKAFQNAAKIISGVRLDIDPEQWLTYQYELGYSHFDIMAINEGKLWLNSFVDKLKKCQKNNGSLSAHWRVIKGEAEQKLSMIPMMENASKMFGVDTF